jgi:hypothetical protein
MIAPLRCVQPSKAIFRHHGDRGNRIASRYKLNIVRSDSVGSPCRVPVQLWQSHRSLLLSITVLQSHLFNYFVARVAVQRNVSKHGGLPLCREPDSVRHNFVPGTTLLRPPFVPALQICA